MFIELTDHLRCPAEHAESFLVLIPDQMNGRQIQRGLLGCPVCQREYRIDDGVVRMGQDEAPVSSGAAGLTADAAATFLGLDGPGGYVGLTGEAALLSGSLAERLPGVHLVAVNPPKGITPTERVSVVLSPRMPLKARALRGVVLGRPYTELPGWVEASIGAVLPGLRAVGQGPVPSIPGFELQAEAAGWWVGSRR